MKAKITNSVTPDAPSSSAGAAGYLAALVGGLLSTIWFPDRWEPKCFLGLVLVAIAVSRTAGYCSTIRPKRLESSRDWMRMMTMTLLAGGVLYVVCSATGACQGLELFDVEGKSSLHWLTVKLPTVVVQQLMLQLLLAPLLLRLVKSPIATAGIGALIFALLHLPNPLLMVLTFVAAVVWIFNYCEGGRLAPIVVSHFVLAILTAGFCGEYVLNMRVGPACFSLLPKQITSADDSLYEFPHCVVGCAERLAQRGDELIIEGWALDPARNVQPLALYLMIDGSVQKIDDVRFEPMEATRWPNAIRSGFVGETCFSFVATLKSVAARSREPVEIFAANANGHLAKIGQMGEIAPINSVPTQKTVVLFPVEVDGRVNQVVQQIDGWHLKGWTADLRAGSLPNEICVEYGGRLVPIGLTSHRQPRPDLAETLGEPVFAECGFDISIGRISVYYLEEMRFFAVDERQQLHPIQFTPHAQTRVSSLLNIGDTPLLR